MRLKEKCMEKCKAGGGKRKKQKGYYQLKETQDRKNNGKEGMKQENNKGI